MDTVEKRLIEDHLFISLIHTTLQDCELGSAVLVVQSLLGRTLIFRGRDIQRLACLFEFILYHMRIKFEQRIPFVNLLIRRDIDLFDNTVQWRPNDSRFVSNDFRWSQRGLMNRQQQDGPQAYRGTQPDCSVSPYDRPPHGAALQTAKSRPHISVALGELSQQMALAIPPRLIAYQQQCPNNLAPS